MGTAEMHGRGPHLPGRTQGAHLVRTRQPCWMTRGRAYGPSGTALTKLTRIDGEIKCRFASLLLRYHSGVTLGRAACADGRRAVSPSFDLTLKVWDLETGAVVATFTSKAIATCCARARKLVGGDAAGRGHLLSLELKRGD